MTPEFRAYAEIDRLLQATGWHVCRAIREFPLNLGHGEADYLLYIDGKAAEVIEAKKQSSARMGRA